MFHMFKNLQRVIRAFSVVPPQTRLSYLSSTLTNTPIRATTHLSRIFLTTQVPSIAAHRKLSLSRSYTTSADGGSKEHSPKHSKSPEEVSWIEFIESSAKAPWLGSLPPDHTDRLKRSYALIFTIILYLGRPRIGSNLTEEAAEATQQFLLAFESAPVPPDSEIARARHATGLLTRTITDNISSIPISSPLRSEYPQIFALTDALVPLADVHLRGIEQGKAPITGDVVDAGGKWQDFWGRAQPIVLALAEQLDESGFGMREELEREAKAEQDRQNKAGAEEKK